MTLTLLIDLDDTLLGNDLGVFLPAYLQALSDHLAPYARPEDLVPTLLSATRQMIHNTRPDRTLQEVFESAFYPALGLGSADLQPAIEAFYTQVFPSLRAVTQPRPEGLQLVEAAFQRGYQVAVATSPLFPLSAIIQRLKWAGLSPKEYPFCLISSYENFHFSKPHPAYYAEVMARLGWPEGPVVMVGNDLENDIIPARCLGLPSFWITSGQTINPGGTFGPSAAGTLAEVLPWLEQASSGELQPDYNRPEALIAILRSTPAALASLSADLPDSLWLENPQEGEWNLTEILCHLRDVEGEVNLPRLEKVLREVNPFLPGMDTDPWAEERLYFCQNGPDALQDFTQFRIQLLGFIENLKPEDWERPARHAIFGPTHLKELVSIIAGHDRLHVRQAYESLGTVSRCATTS